jgi:TolB protein
MKKQKATFMVWYIRVFRIVAICSLFFLLLGSQLALTGESGKITFDRFLGGTSQIVVTDENGQNLINLSNNHVNDGAPEWSLDGKYIAFVSDRDKNQFRNYEIYIMDADGSDQRRITHNQLLDALYPSFSPDGRKLAFTRTALQDPDRNILNYKVFVVNVNGDNEKFLTDGAFPSWSPDGRKIAFCKVNLAKKNWDICLMDTNGNNQVNITNDGMYPAWSPNGKQIAFSSQRAQIGYDNIYKMDSDGQNVVRLTKANEQHDAPIWSPDGQYIAFSILNPSGVEVIKADGSDPKIISDGGNPSWFDPAFARKYAVNPAGKLVDTWGGIKKR